MPENRTYYLIESYLKNGLHEKEREELWNLLQNKEEEENLCQALQQYLSSLPADAAINKESLQHIWKNIVAIDKQVPETKVVPIYRRNVFKWIAAACIVLVTGYGLWVTSGIKLQDTGNKTEVAKNGDIPAPTNTRAVITLANGTKVYLDSAGNGILAQENDVKVVRNEKGEIIYSHGDTETRSETAYNTLYNPRGSKVISLTLSDGTKVWLNSESSLKYPIAFAGNRREVEITGEAYFEVAHNASKPFHVKKGETDIVVLGTHFNVNAYDNEDALRVTLLEGSVRVSPAGGGAQRAGVVIKPGEQAVVNPVNPSIQKILVQDNIEGIMAWKNGRFSFNRSNIQDVMRQLARWYDLEIVYEGQPTKDLFGGDIQRDLPLSKTLDFLRKSQVHFEVEGKKVIVKP